MPDPENPTPAEDKDAIIAQLRDQLGTVTAERDAATVASRAAVTKYRETLTASHPAIPAGLIAGETLEQVDGSLAAAQTIVDQVRASMQPAGAPAAGDGSAPGGPPPAPASPPTSLPGVQTLATRPSWAGLSPTQKITAGLSNGRPE